MKWSDLNGSNYVMNLTDASAINYQNGKRVNLSEATNLYQPHNQSDGVQRYNDRVLLDIDYNRSNSPKAKKLKTIGWIGGATLFTAGATFFVVGLDERMPNKYMQRWRMWGIASIAGSVVWTGTFLIVANNVKNKEYLYSSSLYQYDFQLSNGTSLSVGADYLNDHLLGNNSIGLGLRYKF